MKVKRPDLRVSRENLRHRTVAVLRRHVLEGRIVGRLNESKLSVEIGVSRTPLREALLGLEKEGLVAATPWRGFHVVPLSREEVRDIYPILWTLESLALRLRGVPTAEELDRLDRINDHMEATLHQPAQAFKSDNEWHHALLRPCGNARLLEMIRHIKQSTYRYEYAYMQDARRIIVSVAQHRQILEALRRRDLDAAVVVLEENWRITLDVTHSWLATRQQQEQVP